MRSQTLRSVRSARVRDPSAGAAPAAGRAELRGSRRTARSRASEPRRAAEAAKGMVLRWRTPIPPNKSDTRWGHPIRSLLFFCCITYDVYRNKTMVVSLHHLGDTQLSVMHSPGPCAFETRGGHPYDCWNRPARQGLLGFPRLGLVFGTSLSSSLVHAGRPVCLGTSLPPGGA